PSLIQGTSPLPVYGERVRVRGKYPSDWRGASSVRRLDLAHRHVDRLQLAIMLQRRCGILAAEAGLLGTAERDFDGAQIIGVDPQRSGLQPVGDAMGAGDVAGEDAG